MIWTKSFLWELFLGGKLRADDITLQRVKAMKFKKDDKKERRLSGQSELF